MIVGVKGLKITGDPDVPAGKVSFEITDGRCLALPEDIEDFDALRSYLEQPNFFNTYKVLKKCVRGNLLYKAAPIQPFS